MGVDTKKTPLAVAVFVEIAYLILLAFTAIIPETVRKVVQTWKPGTYLGPIWSEEMLSATNIIVGIVSLFIVAYLGALVFVVVYQAIAKK